MLKTYGPEWLGMSRFFPYPLRAAKLSFSFNFIGWWLKPSFVWRRELTALAKQQGETIWYARWLFLQVSYSRWV